MTYGLRSLVSVVLSASLLLSLPGCGPRRVAPPQPLAPDVFQPLREAVQMPYLELFEEAHRLEFSREQVSRMEQFLEQSRSYCVGQFQQRARDYDAQVNQAQRDLQRVSATLGEDERRERHCNIQNLRTLKARAELLAEQGLKVAFDNRLAKLQLIQEWPAERARAMAALESGAHRQRRWADVEDIGFRKIADNQEDDIARGQDAIQQLRRAGLMPPVLEVKEIQDYVSTVSQRVARNSDLLIPLNVQVLDSREINAFALPGGFIFINRGLLEATDDEAQLVGVIAHEIGHAAARHGHQLMRRVTIASIIFQAAQVAALILTGGAVSLAAYYALQYGFFGLGLVLDLSLLGVSRDFEREADQLGVQYAWRAGYDPTGFIRFFDKMATQKGYVLGLSWFRTHPPFYERMVDSRREMMFLPPREALTTQTAEFEAMKKRLAQVVEESKDDDKDRPSLLAPDLTCPPPPELDLDEEIRELCPIPEEPQSPRRPAVLTASAAACYAAGSQGE